MAEQSPQETAYSVPAPTVHEHYYLQAAVVELQRIRAAIEAYTAAVQAQAARDVELREPKPKPKRGDG